MQDWAKFGGFAGWILAILVCTFLWAISYPPIPSDGPKAQRNDSATNTEQRSAQQGERGTESNPFIVRTVPAPQGTSEAERDEKERYEKAANERGLAVATWVLAYATGLLFIAAAFQVWLFYWQLGLIRDGMKHSADAAEAASNAAKAAGQQVKIAERAIAEADRAWIEPKIELLGPLVFDGDTISVKARVVVTNIGKSPATNVRFDLELEPDAFDASAKIRDAQANIRRPSLFMATDYFGKTLFPGGQADLRQLEGACGS